MSEDLYNIVFKGELVRSFELATVKQNVGQLFKVGGPKLDALFSGKTIVLKRNLNFDTATKYRVAIKKAGARVDLVPVSGPMSDEGDNPLVPKKKVEPAYSGKAVFGEQSPPSTSSQVDAGQAEDRPPLPAVQVEETQSPLEEGLSLAPPGTEVLRTDERASPEVVDVDTSSLTVRDNEGDLLDDDEKSHVEVPQLDLGGLEVAPAEGDLVKEEERKRVPPREVDTSGLSLAEPGARIGGPSGPAPDAPDTSNLSLEP